MEREKDDLKKELEILEAEMIKNDFWSDKSKAQATIKRIGELKDEILGGEKYDKGNAIISILSGAGGDDAEDFSSLLLRMYLKYIERKGWQVTLLHENKNDVGGYRNISLEVSGKGVYGTLKNESGVHRLVRISPFNAKALRHTSFSLVEVVPKLQKDDTVIEIRPEDMRIEFSKSGGPGGQNVNKRETAVRIIHLPTNMSVHVTTERSQEQNRERAMEILKGRLYKKKLEDKLKEKAGLSTTKTTEIEWGSQIRSYVLHPYKMVKDHRTGVEVNDVDGVLESGMIDDFIVAEMNM
ncbi:MAG: PCRF domain-containing protein [Candidatus Nomurabacteria bacterium]